MFGKVAHIGLIVSDIDKSIDFYTNVLGLEFVSRMEMKGEDTNKLFNIKDAECMVAYLKGSDEINVPTIELIQFKHHKVQVRGTNFNETCTAEICFEVKNLRKLYEDLKVKGVEFLSEPIVFESNNASSIAVYFKDIDGIILELIEEL